MRLIGLIGILLPALGGCIPSMVSTTPPLRPLDLTLTRRCDDPVTVPERSLSEREVASMWGRDRIALRDCGRRHAATVEIYEARDAGLSDPAGRER